MFKKFLILLIPIFLLGISIFWRTTTIYAQSFTACDSDINEDGSVNIFDYTLLANDFLKETIVTPRSDIDNNGSVNIFDYSLLSTFFFENCIIEPSPSVIPSTEPSPNLTTTSGFWISIEEISALPESGITWERMLNLAKKGPSQTANMSDQDSKHSTDSMAIALIAAKTDNQAYKDLAVIEMMSAMGTENNYDEDCDYVDDPNNPTLGARSMAMGRNLGAYAIAADVLNFRAGGYDPNGQGTEFEKWINDMRYRINCRNTSSRPNSNIIDVHNLSVSNGNTMAGGARVAAAAYLNDTTDIDEAWLTFKQYAGDTSVDVMTGRYSNYSMPGSGDNEYNSGWVGVENHLIGINPKGAVNDSGFNIDGTIPNDQARGGEFKQPPGYTQYPWEGLQGIYMQALIFSRLGYPAWDVSDQAMKRDVGQNHLLQILSLLIMENPGAMDPKLIREKRALAFDNIKIPTKKTIENHSYRAQYQKYIGTEGVDNNSTTETFFKIKLNLSGSKWNGTPVYIQAGKSLEKVKKEAVITFKHPEPCLCPVGEKHHLRNVVRISLEPSEGINIDFWTKKPGLDFNVEKRSMDFLLREKDPSAQYTEEYQKLLYDSLAGDQTLFANSDEVEKMWSIIDPIIETWQEDNLPPLEKYKKGTNNPILNAIQKEEELSQNSPEKQIAIVGLGKMGANLARRMIQTGWKVTGYNRSLEAAQELEKEGLNVALKIIDLPWILKGPRLIWLMVPAGKVIDDILFGEEGLAYRLSPGDTIIDGGNSFYQNSIKRAQRLKERGINFIDIGVSGGPQGALTGPCLIVGGEAGNQDIVRELCNDLALDDSVRFFPGEGMGHFVKMVHNAIEYGMMQSIAEGMEVLKKSPVPIDLIAAAQIYNNRSVIESRLIGWLENSYKERGTDLADISSTVSHNGEAEWTIKIAKQLGVDMKTIEESFKFRINSKDNPRYSGKVVAALREQFGGHKAVK